MAKNRGLLLDRDGVINADHDYVGRQDQFEFLPGIFPFLRSAQDRGYRLAILTNQSGVARNMYSAGDYEKLTRWMLGEFARQGVTIDLVLACFEHPEAAIDFYRRESFWRKPNPGMVLEAIQRLNLDPARSAFLGDQPRDLEAAARGGIGQRLLLAHASERRVEGAVTVSGYDEALKMLETQLTPSA